MNGLNLLTNKSRETRGTKRSLGQANLYRMCRGGTVNRREGQGVVSASKKTKTKQTEEFHFVITNLP